MAKLPGVALDPQAGEKPSTAAVEPTDLNLHEAAQAVDKIGEAMRVRAAADVQPKLEALAATYGRQFAAEAEKDDGTQPGFAQRQMDLYDLHAAEFVREQNLNGAQAEALRHGVARQRLHWGQRAVETETRNAGQYEADQQRAIRNANVQGAVGGYFQKIGPADKALDDGYDGSDPGYQAKKDALHDEVAAAALEAVSPADRPALSVALNNIKLNRRNEAVTLQDKLVGQVRVRQANTTLGLAANGVVSHPDSARAVMAQVPAMMADLPAAMRQKATDQAYERIAGSRIEGLRLSGQPALAVAELTKGTWDAYLTDDTKAKLLERAQSTAHTRAADALEAMHYGGIVDAAQADADAQAAGDIGQQQELRYRREVGWEEQKALGDGFSQGARVTGFRAAAGFVIDQLEGGAVTIGNDNHRGPSRFGINQAANPDLNVPGLTRDQAVGRYHRYWTAVGADRLPPDQALAAFDAAVLFGPEKANAWQAASQGNVGQFLALETAEMRRLAHDDPKTYGDDLKGWLNRVDKVRGEAARAAAFVNLREGFASDPVKFAAQAPALASQVPALTGEPGTLAWGQAMKGRVAVGQMLNRTYQAPLRSLTDAEAANYKSRIEADPTFALKLAEAGLGSIGPAATRQLLAEVGQQGEASVHLHAADLYAKGSADFARRVEVGLALKGAALKPNDEAALKGAMDAHKELFVDIPEGRQIIYATAHAAMLADQATGPLRTSAGGYITAALGARKTAQGQYGGVGYMGSKRVILPEWLASDRGHDAMSTMAQAWVETGRGPVGPNGQPVSADTLRRAVPVLLADGRYRLKTAGGVAFTTRDGRPFDFDWDQARAGLRARLGASAVLAPPVAQ